MAFSPTPAPSSPKASEKDGVGVSTGKPVPEIIVIPEKFYGVALRMTGSTQAEAEAPKPPPPPPPPLKAAPPVLPASQIQDHSHVFVIVGVAVLFLAVAGGFLYFNWDVLFPKQSVPPPEQSAQVEPAPSAPGDLSATSSGAAVALSWLDTATNETGYRIERKEEGGTFLPVTVLPFNSNAFLDVSVSPGVFYTYRVIALGTSGDSSPSAEVRVMVEVVAPPPPPGPTLPPGGLDSDSDGLSDVEEPMYGTDPRNPDSDGDGFLDGNEAYHLYNPAARAPVRLLDSGLVKPFTASAGWSFYVPMNWIASLDVPDGSQATITTGRSETFIVRIISGVSDRPLLDWYLSDHPDETASDVRMFVTKGGLQGLLGQDRLSAFFLWGDHLFTLRYDVGGETFVNFRTTFEMMLNSLTLSGVPTLSVAEDIGQPGALSGIEEMTSPMAATSSSDDLLSTSSTVSSPTSTDL